jgi:WD40 repeat protein
MWDITQRTALIIMKFADPMSCGTYNLETKLLFLGGWDRTVRAVNLEENTIVKSFVAAKDAINVVDVFDNKIYVAGCDPVIRSFDLETGETKQFEHHSSWVNAL